MLRSVLIAAFFVILSSPASATTFVIRPFPEVAGSAPIIVRAIPGKSDVDWVTLKDGTERIFTFTQMSVEEVLKGAINGNTVLVRELGGEKDGVGMHVPGTAKFKEGEEVVVFLGNRNDDPENSHTVWGMTLGKYKINRDEDGNEYLSGGVLTSGHGHHGHSHAHAGIEDGKKDELAVNHEKWSYDRFKTMVENLGTAPQSKNVPSAKKKTKPAVASVSSESTESIPSTQSSTKEPTPAELTEPAAWNFRRTLILALLAFAVVIGIRLFKRS